MLPKSVMSILHWTSNNNVYCI